MADHLLSCSGLTSFAELPLLPTLLASLTELGLTRPTDIQRRAVPPLLEGRPFVGVAETGSGKTLAYALPMLHRLKALEASGDAVTSAGRPRGLVLVPGRELGDQVSRVFKSLTHQTRLRVRTALGGTAKQVARQNVGGAFDILVATPGRLEQLLASNELWLGDVRILVLDEADQLIDRGFVPVARRVAGECASGVQLAMFTATMPQALDAVVHELFGENPVQVRTRGSQRVVATLTTKNRSVDHCQRTDMLREVLGEDGETGTLLFANTREQCDVIAAWLTEQGIDHVRYTGQMDPLERRRNLARFRNGEVALLLTTDLGGRGLDIERVDRVVNVHLPRDIDNYLHRVGRTARAGRKGLVVNFVSQRDLPLMAKLRRRERD